MYSGITTVTLKKLLDNETTKELIYKALSTYPLFSSDNPDVKDLIPTREILNQKLLNHYKYREIGFETVGRFIDELEIVMLEIMPRYNELYKTVLIMGELPSPFDNVDVIERTTETRTGNTSSQGTSENSGTSSNVDNMTTTTSDTSSTDTSGKSIESGTPQGELSISGKNIDNVTYADKANWNKSEVETNSNGNTSTENNGTTTSNSSSNSESSSNTSETVEHTYTKTGNQGVNTYAHDMNEFRTSIIDVTTQILEDERIKELFMLVY